MIDSVLRHGVARVIDPGVGISTPDLGSYG